MLSVTSVVVIDTSSFKAFELNPPPMAYVRAVSQCRAPLRRELSPPFPPPKKLIVNRSMWRRDRNGGWWGIRFLQRSAAVGSELQLAPIVYYGGQTGRTVGVRIVCCVFRACVVVLLVWKTLSYY